MFPQLFLLVCVSSLCAATKNNFDYFVFSQQWPESVCIGANLSHEHTCKVDNNVTSWTVHGLWPTKKNSSPPGPNFCNTSLPFVLSALYPLWPNLMKYWSNLYKEEVVESLWKHEWLKHGTCAAELSYMKTELLYFNQTLGLNRKFDLFATLKNKGIVPTDETTYHYTDVTNALGGATLQCYYDPSRKTQYLAQVEICLSLQDFRQIPCNSMTSDLVMADNKLQLNRNSNDVTFMKRSDGLRNYAQSRPAKYDKIYGGGKFHQTSMLENCYDTEEIAYPLLHN